MIWVALAGVLTVTALACWWMLGHGLRRLLPPDRGDWPSDQMGP